MLNLNTFPIKPCSRYEDLIADSRHLHTTPASVIAIHSLLHLLLPAHLIARLLWAVERSFFDISLRPWALLAKLVFIHVNSNSAGIIDLQLPLRIFLLLIITTSGGGGSKVLKIWIKLFYLFVEVRVALRTIQTFRHQVFVYKGTCFIIMWSSLLCSDNSLSYLFLVCYPAGALALRHCFFLALFLTLRALAACVYPWLWGFVGNGNRRYFLTRHRVWFRGSFNRRLHLLTLATSLADSRV